MLLRIQIYTVSRKVTYFKEASLIKSEKTLRGVGEISYLSYIPDNSRLTESNSSSFFVSFMKKKTSRLIEYIFLINIYPGVSNLAELV